jgi:hypothetical protein
LVDARDAFWKTHDREPGKYERFVTLTGPTLQGISQEESDKIYNRAFELLGDRVFWTSRIEAGAKHLEFTVNSRGYHTHTHLLLYGRYMERDAEQEAKSKEWRAKRAEKFAARGMRVVKDDLPPLGNLQDEWTSCLTEAAQEFGRVIEWGAPEVNDGWYSQFPITSGEVVEVQPTTAARANVDVRFVREKGRPSVAEIGLTSAIKELTKYVTKASSWSEVSNEQLVEIAEVRRWPRCFELLGKWRRSETPEEKAARREATDKAKADAERKIVRIMPGEKWIDFTERLEREGGHPDSYVIAWDKLTAADCARELERSEEAARLFFYASLDTDFVSRSSSEDATESPPGETLLKPRAKSLMELGESMEFTEWLRLVSIRLADGRRVRTGLLIKNYPDALFYCLDGSKFEGFNIIQKRRRLRVGALCGAFERREVA